MYFVYLSRKMCKTRFLLANPTLQLFYPSSNPRRQKVLGNQVPRTPLGPALACASSDADNVFRGPLLSGRIQDRSILEANPDRGSQGRAGQGLPKVLHCISLCNFVLI